MLTKKDLQSIKEVIDCSIDQNNVKIIEEVKDIVDFAIEKSELRMETKMEAMMDGKISKVLEKIDREVTDLAETNREFLKNFDNHENRIVKLELKTGISK